MEVVDGFLKYHLVKIDLEAGLPIHIDFFGLVKELKSFITSTESEKTMATLLDIPGMGKTTTCRVAAVV